MEKEAIAFCRLTEYRLWGSLDFERWHEQLEAFLARVMEF